MEFGGAVSSAMTRGRYSSVYRQVVRRRATRDAGTWTIHDERRKAFYRHFVSHGDLVFDVGANWGNRTKVFLAIGARVVSVEPQAVLAEALRRNYGALGGLDVVEAAITDREGTVDLLVSDADTLTTTNPEWVESVRSSGRFTQRSWNQTVPVPGLTLDALVARFGRPQFIKIDIEGGELAALRGLSEPVDGVTFELTPERCDDAEACVDHLAGLGLDSFNVSLGESGHFHEPEWLPAEEIKVRLRHYAGRGGQASWADVCARRSVL